MESFPAIVATENAPASLQDVPESSLPEGDVTVDVNWSSLNYKDGLAVTGKGRIVRSFPMVCGIDLAGTVRSSDSDKWSPGDEVVVTGWGLSETHPGRVHDTSACAFASGCRPGPSISPCARPWPSGRAD